MKREDILIEVGAWTVIILVMLFCIRMEYEISIPYGG